jgi:hypothetical protein
VRNIQNPAPLVDMQQRMGTAIIILIRIRQMTHTDTVSND